MDSFKHLFNNTFIINKDEMLKIYDLIVNIRDKMSNKDGGLNPNENDLHKDICDLDDIYSDIMVDCGLLTIDNIDDEK